MTAVQSYCRAKSIFMPAAKVTEFASQLGRKFDDSHLPTVERFALPGGAEASEKQGEEARRRKHAAAAPTDQATETWTKGGRCVCSRSAVCTHRSFSRPDLP